MWIVDTRLNSSRIKIPAIKIKFHKNLLKTSSDTTPTYACPFSHVFVIDQYVPRLCNLGKPLEEPPPRYCQDTGRVLATLQGQHRKERTGTGTNVLVVARSGPPFGLPLPYLMERTASGSTGSVTSPPHFPWTGGPTKNDFIPNLTLRYAKNSFSFFFHLPERIYRAQKKRTDGFSGSPSPIFCQLTPPPPPPSSILRIGGQ